MEQYADLAASNDSYLNQISSYLPEFTDLTQYLPEEMQKIPIFQPNTSAETTRNQSLVLFNTFDKVYNSIQVLILGYTDGFQLWDIRNVDSFQEILSFRGPPVHFARIIQQTQLIVVFQEATEQTVRLYSIDTLQIQWEISFSLADRLLNIDSNPHGIVLVFLKRVDVYGLDGVFLYTIETREQVLPQGAMALGSRWLATPALSIPYIHPKSRTIPDSLLSRDESTALSSTKGDITYDLSMSELLQGVVSYIGRSVSGTTEEYSTTAGGIQIHDTKTQKVLCQFVSHKSAEIAFLKFDPSELLLLSAPVDGQTLHIHRLFPDLPHGSNERLLYKINRGLTRASIINAAFSCDSRWVAVSTARGTTHIFAMTVEGGPVDVTMYNKMEEDKEDTKVELAPSSRSLQTLLEERKRDAVVSLKALCRIRQTLTDEATNPPLAAEFFNGKLYLAAWSSLSQYGFEPKVRMKTKVSPVIYKLRLELNDQRRWDMKRADDWQEKHTCTVCESTPIAQTSTSVLHTELATHRPDLVPLWAHPKVSFQVLTKPVGILDVVESRTLAIRRVGPVPLDTETLSHALKTCRVNNGYFGQGDSPVFSGRDDSPSPLKDAVVPQLQLSDSISNAVLHPTEFGSWKSETSLLEGEGPARPPIVPQNGDYSYFSPDLRNRPKELSASDEPAYMDQPPTLELD